MHMFYCSFACVVVDIQKFCLAVQRKVLDEVVDRDVEKGED